MQRVVTCTSLALALVALTACGSGGGGGGAPPPPPPPPAPAPPPPPPTPPDVPPAPPASADQRTTYDGITDDLLTGGLGWDGLQGPAPSVSAAPTAAELRTLAIYNNYRALVDMTSAGGYGSLYGPHVAPNGTVDTTPGAGKVAGSEYLVLLPGGPGFALATLMVQVPNTFNPAEACIVTATSSGSRGVYGAISAAGEWALKRGCAVAYTDKGTGNGAHELGSDTVTLLRGETANAGAAGAGSVFTAQLSAADQTAFVAQFPHRYAFKHAHSQLNPERFWGAYTLTAIQYAFNVLNFHFGTQTITPANTLVIADSVSNGAGAALAAAEQDTAGLIDGVVATEPQISLFFPNRVTVLRGVNVYPASAIGRPLYDYTTLANLLQPCAAHALTVSASPFLVTVPPDNAQARCASLVAGGYITGADFQTRANNALAALRAAGWEPDSDLLHASHWGFQATTGVAVTYANAYGRASVRDNLCGYSFSTVAPGTADPGFATSPMPTIFALGNGVPPTGAPTIAVMYNLASGGPVVHTVANGDFGYAGAHCLRQLWEGAGAEADAIRQSVNDLRLTGNLRGKPSIILHGRADALVPVNHTSRPYFGLNRIADANPRLSYIEVTNAQHFEAFLGLAGYNTRFIPLHHYSIQALNLMYNHLRNPAANPLPPSQVVRTTPRGAGAPPINEAMHLPPISANPGGNEIVFVPATNTVFVPN
jgi:hydroxybutyrate-dimer hydrolase